MIVVCATVMGREVRDFIGQLIDWATNTEIQNNTNTIVHDMRVI